MGGLPGLANLALPPAKNTHLASIASNVHSIFAWILIVPTIGHIAAAWYHQLIRKDNLIRRMV